MPVNDYDSTKVAAEIVRGALEGGAIKLNGPGGVAELVTTQAKKDADYLTALISALETKLQGK